MSNSFRRLFRGFALILAAATIPAAPVQAATFAVSTTEDGHDAVRGDGVCETAAGTGVCTLRAASEEANALAGADAVTVPAGLYALTTLEAGRRVLPITSDLRLTGAGSEATIVDALNLDVVVEVPAGATVEISGLTITGGHGRNVGGIANGGDLTLRRCIVTGNAADYPGGGINNGGVLTLVASTIKGNSAYTGAGIFNAGTLNVTASEIADNAGGSGGGGLWNDGAAAVATITASRIAGNSAGGYGGGGGITNGNGGTVHLVRSTVSGNTHWRFAAGIANDFDSTVTLTNSTVRGNVTTTYDAGGIWNRGTLSLVHSTVTANQCAGGGGGIANSGVLTLEGSIVAGNAASVGADCWGTVASAGYNLIQSTADCTIGGNTTGNLTGVDPLLGPLADNGGPTATHALLEGSPAIDAAGPSCPEVDQRSAPRPVDGDDDGTALCDIGAFEARSVPVSGVEVAAVSPTRGGDGGSVSVVLTGSGFDGSSEVRLVRSGDGTIPGAPVEMGQAGTVLVTRFDLAGRARGAWDVMVTNGDGDTATLPGAFTVEETRAPKLWVGITGRNGIAPLHPTRYRIAFGNEGNVDAFAVPLSIGELPKDVDLRLGFPLLPPPPQDGQVAMDWSQVPFEVAGEGLEKVHSVPLVLPVVPAGSIGWVDVTIDVPTSYPDGSEISLAAELVDGAQATDPRFIESLADGAVAYALRDFGVAVPAVVVPELEQYVSNALERVVAEAPGAWVGSLGTGGGVYAFAHLVIDAALFAAARTGEMLAGGPVIQSHGSPTPAECAEMGGYVRINPTTGKANCPMGGPWMTSVRGFNLIPVRRGYDPNGKAGPSGVGGARFVPGTEPQRYQVFFENLPAASAPAQEVVVTDALDTTVFDPATFALGPIGFGDTAIDVPPGLTAFETEVDLRPGTSLLVRVEAGLDAETGVATWRFRSIDPETGEPPEDPLVGFLPPNAAPPEGEGNVVFSVRPRPGLPTGTELHNEASIVFDVNDPIGTPAWVNTVDAETPASLVTAAEAPACSQEVRLAWSGTDAGSGVAAYRVFASQDGGPFETALPETAETEGTFVGRFGRSYLFYSQARDEAGNLEDAPAMPDVGMALGDCGPHDLAVTKISAPARVKVTGKKPLPVVRVSVRIQNRSAASQTIGSLDALREVVGLTVRSLGGCPDPLPALVEGKPQKKLPFTLKSKKKLKVAFDVPIACVNDAAASGRKDPGHEDYALEAAVNHAVLGGDDAHPDDDACPRAAPPKGTKDPFPDGKIAEKGCGAKTAGGPLGAPVLVDLVAKP